MGILSPVCITSDGTRLYAFAYGSNGSGRSFSYVLIKSNSVPSYTLNDLSWTLVSTLGGPNAYSLSLNAYSCVVDDMGVFTIVSSAFNGTGTASKGMTLGLQYQPPGNTSGGSGTWNNVYAPSGYTYSSTNTLFFLKDSSGKDTLMKAYTQSGAISGSANAVLLSTIDPITLTFSQETSLTLPQAQYGELGATVFSGNTLFVVGSVDIYTQLYLTSIPLSTASTAMPPLSSIAVQTPSGIGNCLSFSLDQTYMSYNNSLVIACTPSEHTGPAGNISYFYIYSGSSLTQLPQVSGIPPSLMSLIPITGSTVSFLFGVDWYGKVYSISLNGATPGTLIKGDFAVNITEAYGNNNSSGSGSNTGLIVGICVGAVVLLGVLLCLNRFLKRRDKEKRQPEAIPEAKGGAATYETKRESCNLTDNPLQQGQITSQQSGQLHPLTCPSRVPVDQPYPQPHSTNIPNGQQLYPQSYPMHVPSSQQQYPQVNSTYYPVTSTQSDLQQQLMLTSHPRPDIVTSLGSNGPVQVGAQVMTPPVWQPRPFVPPVPAQPTLSSPAASQRGSESAGGSSPPIELTHDSPAISVSSPPIPNHRSQG